MDIESALVNSNYNPCIASFPGHSQLFNVARCTLKSERAWYLKSRARAILLRNKQLEKGDKTNRLFYAIRHSRDFRYQALSLFSVQH